MNGQKENRNKNVNNQDEYDDEAYHKISLFMDPIYLTRTELP
eukprot:CAMPEP_0171309574 /NCGR_PEP_ID=MMETSP0816-20121228/19753_1 /TAXON_ID=420281 /ORGANISM="Proboscia inermis, Strain CCAP1064/1" /LENGTH=41 /DNA_ID= /DNA_START= /DNA_END= /DNA_ORIENTATION=